MTRAVTFALLLLSGSADAQVPTVEQRLALELANLHIRAATQAKRIDDLAAENARLKDELEQMKKKAEAKE